MGAVQNENRRHSTDNDCICNHILYVVNGNQKYSIFGIDSIFTIFLIPVLLYSCHRFHCISDSGDICLTFLTLKDREIHSKYRV